MSKTHKHRRFRAIATLSASTLALSLAHGAYAETAADDTAGSDVKGFGEIVITARKREEKLQDVPISVAAVSGQTLEAQKIDRVSEYAAKVPNFTALQQNTRVSGLYIRGIGGNANSDGSESGVGLIVDNVFYTHVGFSWADFTDIDHVEVARGPQGTLLGKNTTVGAVVITTAAPNFNPQASVSATLGNRGRSQVRATLNGPLVGDKVAGRLSIAGDTNDGWITNHFNGQKLLDTNRYSVRGQLLFDGGETFSDRFIAEALGSSEYNNFYPPAADPLVFANGTARSGWDAKLHTRFGYTPSYDVRNNANLNNQGQTVSRILGSSNQADWSLGKNKITAITAWRHLIFRPHNDSDGTPLNIIRAGYDVDVKQYSQELRLASPTGGTFEYQAGFYGLRETVKSNNRTIFFSDAPLYFLGVNAPAILNGVEYDQFGRTTVTSAALFGQGTWRLTEKAAIAAGVRLTHETRKASNQGYSFGGVATPLVAYRAALLAGFGGTFRVADEKSTDAVSWLINPSYKVSDDVLAYATIARGTKSGAANLGAITGNPVIIQPETSTAYEVGLKNTLAGGSAFINAGLFWNDIDNYQAAQINPTGASSSAFLANVGKVRLRGLELDSRWRVDDSITLSASGAWNDARYVSYKNAPPPQELRYVGAPKTIDLSGKQIPGASALSGQISLDYQRPLPGDLTLTAYATQTFKSATRYIIFSDVGHQQAYGLTSIGLGLLSPQKHYFVTVWAKNLFDQKYILAAGSASTITPYISILGDPRTVGITLTAKAF